MVAKDNWIYKNNLYKEKHQQSTKQKWNLLKRDNNMNNHRQLDMLIDNNKVSLWSQKDSRCNE